ncbi:MAG: capsule biosynthesis protein [Rubritepida sp.]|nr:capsule biosynthesis protein [Rubritepida sp.]
MRIWTKLSPNTNTSSTRAAPATGREPATMRAPATRAPATRAPATLRAPHMPATSPAARLTAGERQRPLLSGMPSSRARRRGLGDYFRDHPFLTWVMLPTLIAAVYLFFFSAPQYLSESRYTVRAQMPRGQQNVGGEILGTAGFVTSPENITSVRDFLLSYDAVRRVREEIDLLEAFRPSFADPVFRLWWENPTAERLRQYFRWQVSVTIDASTGITDLRVWSFRPTDSQQISRRLLTLGEEVVNEMNFNIREEAMRSSRIEQQRAEERLLSAQAAVTVFRQTAQSVDPNQLAGIAIGTIGQLESDAARARSDLQTLEAYARANNPQIQNMRNRIQGLERQAVLERSRMAAAGTGITEQLAAFTRLTGEVDLASQQLAAARITLDRANGDAQRQQIFLLRIVEPNLAERSLFPLPYWASLYVFASLSLLYGLAWLVLAGMREHAR